MPRLTASKEQIYIRGRIQHYGNLDQAVRSTVYTALIRDQWDQLVRFAASLRNRTAQAHVGLRRWAAVPRPIACPDQRFGLGPAQPLPHTLYPRRRPQGADATSGQPGRGQSRYVERVLTTVTTLRQQRRDVLSFLTESCATAIRGNTLPSLLPKP